jgi:hypothetical protein
MRGKKPEIATSPVNPRAGFVFKAISKLKKGVRYMKSDMVNWIN